VTKLQREAAIWLGGALGVALVIGLIVLFSLGWLDTLATRYSVL
jgi:nitrate reductase gamma subunit